LRRISVGKNRYKVYWASEEEISRIGKKKEESFVGGLMEDPLNKRTAPGKKAKNTCICGTRRWARLGGVSLKTENRKTSSQRRKAPKGAR